MTQGPPLIRANQLLDYVALFEKVYADDPKALAALEHVRTYIVTMRDNPEYQASVRWADQFPPFVFADGMVA